MKKPQSFLAKTWGLMFATVALMLFLAVPVAAAAPPMPANTVFKHYAGPAESLKPSMTPGDARYTRNEDANDPNWPWSSASWEWIIWDKDHRQVAGVKVLIMVIRISVTERRPPSAIVDMCKCTRSDAAALYRESQAFESSVAGFARDKRSDYRIVASSPMPEEFKTSGAVDVLKFVAARKAGQLGNFNYVYSDSLEKPGETHYERRYHSAGNVRLLITVSGKGPDPEKIAYDVLTKLSRGGGTPPKQVDDDRISTKDLEPPMEDLRIEAHPLLDINIDNVALIPAGSGFPARITANIGKTGAGNADRRVEFRIVSGSGGELQSGSSQGQSVTVAANAAGTAVANFRYVDTNTLTGPVRFKIAIEAGKRKADASVVAGLGLGFQRTRYVQMDTVSGIYPLVLKLQSHFHPKLNLGAFLLRAEQSGVWGNNRVGTKLCIEWVNRPDENRNCDGYRGTGHVAFNPYGEAFIAGDSAPTYNLTNFIYPAVQLGAAGKYIYKVVATVAAVDRNGAMQAEAPAERLLENPLLTISTENPARWYQALACSFEAQGVYQYLVLETVKKIPVYGEAVDIFSTAASLTCKLLQEEYESAFYELGTVLGGQYLDHLMEPDVLTRLTPVQQEAVKLAKKGYDEAGDVKRRNDLQTAIQKTRVKSGYDDEPVDVGRANNPLENEQTRLQRESQGSMSNAPSAPAPLRKAPAADPGPAPPPAAPKQIQDVLDTANKLKDVFRGLMR